VTRRLLVLVVAVLALSSCQLDIAVDIDVEPDGTGQLAVVTTADAELVEAVPGIADELVLDDVVAAGWNVEGPVATPDGGLVVTMTHDFVSAGEATNLLRSLGPPFNQVEVGRGTNGDVTTNQLEGRLGLPDGFRSFADDDLVAEVGAVPFAEEIEASGATPDESIAVTVEADLPGEIVEAETNGTVGDGVIRWEVPTDGEILEWSARTEQAPSVSGSWARPLSIAALVALVAWIAFMGAFILFVFVARSRRAWRYKRRRRSTPAPERQHVDVG
jgi:hypothetical protein